jgi:hypothetical protein
MASALLQAPAQEGACMSICGDVYCMLTIPTSFPHSPQPLPSIVQMEPVELLEELSMHPEDHAAVLQSHFSLGGGALTPEHGSNRASVTGKGGPAVCARCLEDFPSILQGQGVDHLLTQCHCAG